MNFNKLHLTQYTGGITATSVALGKSAAQGFKLEINSATSCHMGDAYDGINYGVLQITRPATHDNKGYISFIRAFNAVWTMGFLSGTNNFVIGYWTLAGAGILLTPDGKVGIGTTSPSSTLHVVGDVKANAIHLSVDSDITGNVDGAVSFWIKNSNAGTNAYSIFLLQNNIGNAYMFLCSSGKTNDGGANTLTIRNDIAGGDIRLQAGTLTVWLSSDGKLGVGTTSPAAALDVAGDIKANAVHLTGISDITGNVDNGVEFFLKNLNAGTSAYSCFRLYNNVGWAGMWLNGGGVAGGANSLYIGNQIGGPVHIYSGSAGVKLSNAATAWSANSDLRLKRDISTVKNSLDKINSIRGVYFNYLEDKPTARRRLGVIAQDLLQAVPEAVDQDESSGMYQVRADGQSTISTSK